MRMTKKILRFINLTAKQSINQEAEDEEPYFVYRAHDNETPIKIDSAITSEPGNA